MIFEAFVVLRGGWPGSWPGLKVRHFSLQNIASRRYRSPVRQAVGGKVADTKCCNFCGKMAERLLT